MSTPSLSEALQETLSLFKPSSGPQTTSEVAARLDLGRRSTYERLDRLVSHGELETKKVGANGRVWWHPTEKGRDQPATAQALPTAEPTPMYSAFETAAVGAFVLDANRDVAWVNNTAERYFAIDRDDIITRPYRDVITEHLAPRVDDTKAFTEAVLAGGEHNAPAETSECHVTVGEGRWLEHCEAPITSGEHAGGHIELFYDISERKARERELKQTKTRLEVLFDETPDAITILDKDVDIVDVNKQSVNNLGYSRDELRSMNLTEIDTGLDADEIRTFRALIEEQAINVEREHKRKDGSTFPVEVSVAKIDFDGEPRYLGLSRDITGRKAKERVLKRQREQLAALSQINTVVHDITDAVIGQSTREEIEQTVCETLTGVDSYEFAWIGEIDPDSQTVRIRAEAGVDGYLEDITISVDPDDELSKGPAGRALRTGEIQTRRDVRTDTENNPWWEHNKKYEFRSSAAIPIAHDGTIYGVLKVYAGRPNAFEGPEHAVISRLGEIVGHAIAAIERKRALISDEVIEVEFSVPNILEELGVVAPNEGWLSFDHVVTASDEAHLIYGAMSPDARETFDALVGQYRHWDAATIISEDDDRTTFQIRASELPLRSEIASEGGSVSKVLLKDGNLDVQIQLPTSADVGSIRAAIERAYPNAQFLAKRQFPRPEQPEVRIRQALSESLTDRQQTVLEAAYHRGYFEWPREASGEDLAKALGIAPPTFSQHLRKAQKAVFDSVYS